jgi:hypothetical protein
MRKIPEEKEKILPHIRHQSVANALLLEKDFKNQKSHIPEFINGFSFAAIAVDLQPN